MEVVWVAGVVPRPRPAHAGDGEGGAGGGGGVLHLYYILYIINIYYYYYIIIISTFITLVPGTSCPLCSQTTNLGLTMVALITHSSCRELCSRT